MQRFAMLTPSNAQGNGNVKAINERFANPYTTFEKPRSLPGMVEAKLISMVPTDV